MIMIGTPLLVDRVLWHATKKEEESQFLGEQQDHIEFQGEVLWIFWSRPPPGMHACLQTVPKTHSDKSQMVTPKVWGQYAQTQLY